ncbi:ABC transporter ATP-binding protein [Peribacillus alkalitolerans]|uniref:ABC transporter ATP-binding protein n=1 Tax=Peribacillus alkalitolerans TaxID=1550385 RepID=UPI0013D85C72|nr:ABC transporter ATP-binding protein [Peribacillus alkalitolerans]
MALLQVKNVRKIYKGNISFEALKEVNFSIEEGEFVAVMGPSGSGKTTMLNVISTIDSPTSGEIFINGINPHHLNGDKLAQFRRKQLGFVFQDYNLLSTLTVGENIVLPLILDGVKEKEASKRLWDISTRLGIESLIDKRTYEISGGQAQRTAVARALIHKPALILADEPTGNLDSKASKDVMEMMVQMNKELKTTMMMVTHDAFAASYSDRVLFIKDGQIFNELYKGENRSVFYQNIVNVLSMLGGENHEPTLIRV